MNDHINKYESFMFLETKNDKKKKNLIISLWVDTYLIKQITLSLLGPLKF